jgi:hypothetical protein
VTDGGHNLPLDTDPLFEDADARNYRLVKGSPCIDKGLVQGWMTGATDLEGKERISPSGTEVDMGCYETYFAVGTVIMLR